MSEEQPPAAAPAGAAEKKPLPKCQEADVEVTEYQGLVIYVLNCISPGTGTLLSSCLDKNGCNCQAVGWSFLQSLLVCCCCYGWYLSIIHGKIIYENSKGKK